MGSISLLVFSKETPHFAVLSNTCASEQTEHADEGWRVWQRDHRQQDKQMDAALSALLESVTEALKNGEKVVLPGFGMFGVKLRPARQGRNLITGEQLAIPERKLPAFKAGKTLKDAVAAE